MPKQINAGQLTQALQRAFGFKGRYTPMLDEVVVPVYVIADPSPAAVTKLCGATATVTSVMDGGRAYIQLFNPVGSGNVVNLTLVAAQSSIKEALNVIFFDGSPAGTVVRTDIHFRDRRNVPGLPSSLIRRNEDTAGVGFVGDLIATLEVDGALAQTAAWIASAEDPRQPLAVLGEGQGIIIQQNDNLASTIRVNYGFIEIPATEVRPPGGIP